MSILLTLIASVATCLPREDPADFETRFQRGIQLLTDGKVDEGIALYDSMLKERPKERRCSFNLACGWMIKSRTDDESKRAVDVARAQTLVEQAVEAWFGQRPTERSALMEDPDIAPLRDGPNWKRVLDLFAKRTNDARVWAATPLSYVPAALEKVDRVPLVVVLHAMGSTKEKELDGPWKHFADEIGAALVFPGGRLPVALDPEDGCDWFETAEDYAASPSATEATIHDAVKAFAAQRKIDPSRVIVVGCRASGFVAAGLVLDAPGLYHGALVIDQAPSPVLDELVGKRGAGAVKSGARLSFVLDPERAIEPDPKKATTELEKTKQVYAAAGFGAVVHDYDAKTIEPAALQALWVGEMRRLLEPVVTKSAVSKK